MNIDTINRKIQPQKGLLLQHSLYGKITTITDLNCFLESHIYAQHRQTSLRRHLDLCLD